MAIRNRQGDGQFAPTPQAFMNRASPPDSRRKDIEEAPYPIILPLNYAVPDGAESINFWSVLTTYDLPENRGFPIITFEAPSAGITRILFYALYSSVPVGDRRVTFIPEKDGTRCYPYHGDPKDGNVILSTGSNVDSVGTDSLVYAPLTLLPKQRLTWKVLVRAGVPPAPLPPDSLAGVRIVGYVDEDVTRHQQYLRNA